MEIILLNCLLAAKGDLLGCGFFFAVLLNFKHIYMYLAVSLETSQCATFHLIPSLQPAYFIYLLRAFCMTPQGQSVSPSLNRP